MLVIVRGGKVQENDVELKVKRMKSCILHQSSIVFNTSDVFIARNNKEYRILSTVDNKEECLHII